MLTSVPAHALPRDFKFCVSTAAHQIEGQNTNSDWWLWENTPGKIKNGDTSLVATDSWNHIDEDIANMKWMGVDTYRFSVEWAKIEPREGEFDEAMIDRYVAQIDALKAAGIEPMVTLYHFTFPIWISKKGGWDWDGLPEAFERFTEKVVSKIGKRVTIWITLNEPMTIIAAGYVSNIFPPAKNDLRTMQVPMTNMVRAHARSYHTIHRLLDSDTFKPKVGLAHHLRNFDPYHPRNPIDRYAARTFDRVFNWAIPDALTDGWFHLRVPFLLKTNLFIPEAIGTQDFFGLNYYSRDMIAVQLFKKELLARKTPPGAEVQDLGWEIYPQGMARLLDEIQVRFPKMPIWITENGIADHTDEKRAAYIRAHLDVLTKAMAPKTNPDGSVTPGADIQGYCHWTLNDNFEWAEGYTAKFGLFSLEPETLRRLPRSSAYDFKDIVARTKAGLPL